MNRFLGITFMSRRPEVDDCESSRCKWDCESSRLQIIHLISSPLQILITFDLFSLPLRTTPRNTADNESGNLRCFLKLVCIDRKWTATIGQYCYLHAHVGSTRGQETEFLAFLSALLSNRRGSKYGSFVFNDR